MASEADQKKTREYWQNRMDGIDGRVSALETTFANQFGPNGTVTTKLQTMHDDILISKTYRKAKAKMNDRTWNVVVALMSGSAAAAFLAWYKD